MEVDSTALLLLIWPVLSPPPLILSKDFAEERHFKEVVENCGTLSSSYDMAAALSNSLQL